MTRQEDALARKIDRSRAPKRQNRCAYRADADAAFKALAKAKGWPEARCWAASKAFFQPNPEPANDRVRAEAEAVFGVAFRDEGRGAE